MSRSPQPSFLLKLTNRECHLSSLPTRNKYWAIFRLSICKAKILNGCKSCSGVIVGHLPPLCSPTIFILGFIMTKTRYPRTNKINFSWILPCCNFSFQKKVFFQGVNFCFLKQHSWLDNWIDCSPIRSPFVYFCQIKGEIVTWKMHRLMGSHFWILCASCVSDIIAFSSPFFSFHFFYFWGCTAAVHQRVHHVFLWLKI